MKKYLILGVFALIGTLTYAQQKAAVPAVKTDGPIITLEETSFDFGTITQGDVVEHVFKFANTGNQPLIITNIQISCGCTTPQWPREPIMPGAKGEIKVGFNSAGKLNKQNKTLPIISNSVNDASITFTTNVLAKEAQ